jgi:Domain of unknown function (DUF4180)
MSDNLEEMHGQRVYFASSDGPLLRSGRDANDLIGDARSANASLAVLPLERLDPAFFELRSGVAGEFVQKFVNYRVKLAILGDTTELSAQSKSLHDFIYESNQRGSVWFLANRQELEDRLARTHADQNRK